MDPSRRKALTDAFLQAGFLLRPMFKSSRFFVHLIGKIRRFWLVHFGKAYVAARLEEREGACRQCGTCCNLLVSCPMLTKEKRCLIYNSFRWQVCRVFPIDQRDVDAVALDGAVCGYRFPKASAAITAQVDARPPVSP
jgi:hypothetical protein